MNTKIVTALLTAATALAFAEETSANALPLEAKQVLAAAKNDRDWFGYVQMGLGDSNPAAVDNILPGLGVGVRFALPVGAIDLSTSYTGVDAFASERTNYFWTLPSVSYLYYTSPTKQQSFYAGAGLAFAGLKEKGTAESFTGFAPKASLGYEMNRLETVCSFVQLDVTHPTLATATAAPRASWVATDFRPVVQLSLGLGY